MTELEIFFPDKCSISCMRTPITCVQNARYLAHSDFPEYLF
jgi:hypothetical protein